jgi:hypothetical protein
MSHRQYGVINVAAGYPLPSPTHTTAGDATYCCVYGAKLAPFFYGYDENSICANYRSELLKNI